MIRLPRKCVEVLQPKGKTTVTKYVTALEVPLMRARWYNAAEKTHLATPVAHVIGSPAECYWHDFPSAEDEMLRLKRLYNPSDPKEPQVFDKIYPSDEDFLATAERLIEEFAANPVLPESARPRQAPPAVLEMLAIAGDLGGTDREALALSIASVGLTSPADIAGATLSHLCRAHLLTPETAAAVRAAAHGYIAATPQITAAAYAEKHAKV